MDFLLNRADTREPARSSPARGRGSARPLRAVSPPRARAVACLDVKGYDETAAEIVAAGGHAWGYECDVTDDGAVRRAVDLAFTELGGLSVVCNVAGIGQFYRTETLDPAVFDRIIAVNLRGTFLVCRYSLPHMLEATGGVIVNTTSVSGIVGNPWNAAYAASKGGVLMLTKALAAEYRHRGVRVNGIAPGMVATDLSAGFTDFFVNEDIDLSEFGRGQPVRAATPDEIAATFAFVDVGRRRVHVGRDHRARRRGHLLGGERTSGRRRRRPDHAARRRRRRTRGTADPAARRRARPKRMRVRGCSTGSTRSTSCRSAHGPTTISRVSSSSGSDSTRRESVPASTPSAARRRSERSTRHRRGSPRALPVSCCSPGPRGRAR